MELLSYLVSPQYLSNALINVNQIWHISEIWNFYMGQICWKLFYSSQNSLITFRLNHFFLLKLKPEMQKKNFTMLFDQM